MTRNFDYVVIGAGVLGTAAAYWLARSGESNVLVVEQFALGHDRGASEDHSRIIRHSYHSTTYTALTHAMYEHWSELEAQTGMQLVTRTGGLDLAVTGTAGEEELANYRAALRPFDIPAEDLDAAAIRDRWPQWRIDDDVIGMYQSDSGILDVRRACAAQIAMARRLGVEFAPHTTVLDLAPTDDCVVISTDRGPITAGNVVVCVASWIEKFLPCLGLRWNISLTQEQVGYFATPNLAEFSPDRFPVWIWHGDTDLFYGFPVYGEAAVKISRDFSGRFITSDERSSRPDPEDTALFRAFLEQRLPAAAGPELLSKTCVYDLPPDRDFVIDRVPGHPRVTIGLGAAHAAKFGNLLGHLLADLARTGTTAFAVDAFRADRPALDDPAFVSAFRMGR
ncbi:N-methyl-L-tryptophan oxidase [Amycolatopsis jejuensis]|uniref:N-methyl-L-tryptophan oxidase n=1 Tax=Amycolatopsis jejuensis TaxID=330084 RepID=UPI0005268B74|nr:N-methyl-L-tryptophan oxidase [Amycolatopsis jejuensis]